MKQQQLCNKIAQTVHKALLYEVSIAPKPGLVDPISNGAHKDMNFFTFLDSAVALYPFFYEFARIGSEWDTIDDKTLMTIRPLGQSCEEAMFQATAGVNTHKGAIFILGILSAVAAYLYTTYGQIREEELCSFVAKVADPALHDFCKKDRDLPSTKGETLYQKYGVQGIRGEMALGLPTVRNYGIPILRKVSQKEQLPYALLDSLISIVAHLEDTNILSRRGEEILAKAQHQAQDYLYAGGYGTEEGRVLLQRMNHWFVEQGISPGGAADLLAASLAIVWLEQLS